MKNHKQTNAQVIEIMCIQFILSIAYARPLKTNMN
jgi:hypothetical protein